MSIMEVVARVAPAVKLAIISSVFVTFGDELSPDLKATCVFAASATEHLAKREVGRQGPPALQQGIARPIVSCGPG